MSVKPIIQASHLSKIYRTEMIETVALSDVSFQIDQGEFVAIMGPSGSGKSTFLNMTGMLDTATSGEIHINGYDITRMNSNARAEYRLKHIGFVFQFFNLFMELTALENVMFPMMLNKQSDYKDRAKELLGLVGLGDRLNHLPSELSGGQQQRVTIARSLANSPKILLAFSDNISGKAICSFIPIVKFPDLSKDLGSIPRKSRDLGRTMWISLSKKSYIFFLLKVQAVPIFNPSLNLKAAIDFFAFLKTGFCPQISEISCMVALSILFCSSPDFSTICLPKPVLTTTFSILGTAIGFL